MVLRQVGYCLVERCTFSVTLTVLWSSWRKQRKRPKTLAPRLFLRRLRGSLLRLRSMMRLEVKPVAREWHLLGNEGHDRLITAGYRSSHSLWLRYGSGPRLSRHFKDDWLWRSSAGHPVVRSILHSPRTTSCVLAEQALWQSGWMESSSVSRRRIGK